MNIGKSILFTILNESTDIVIVATIYMLFYPIGKLKL